MTDPLKLKLSYGSRYGFNFAGAPGGIGKYLGTIEVGQSEWLIFETRDGLKFFNPALLCTLRPEKDES